MIKNKTKSFLIIFITLLIGIGIGFEISEIMIRKRFDEFKDVRRPRGFINIFERIIKTDENQKPIVDSIVLDFHKRTEKIMQASRQIMDKELDSLKTELKPILRTDQFERLDNEIKKIKKGPQGPPPPGNRKPWD